jgi:hypothetical protein
MVVLGAIALLLVSLGGYSFGASVTTRRKQVTPGPWDLLAVAGCWAVGLYARGAVTHWPAMLLSFAFAFTVGATVVGLRSRRAPARKAGVHGGAKAPTGWMEIVQGAGQFQSHLLMSLFYFTVLMPFGIGASLFGDPLKMRRAEASTFWVRRPVADDAALAEQARKQF